MDTTKNLYIVYPQCDVGSEEPFEASPEELRDFLLKEIDDTCPVGGRPCWGLSLPQVLGLGFDRGEYVKFDVTRPACSERRLIVSSVPHPTGGRFRGIASVDPRGAGGHLDRSQWALPYTPRSQAAGGT